MRLDQSASANGEHASSVDEPGSGTEFKRLRAKCRHQDVMIDTLSEAVSTLRVGAKALKAENSELRAENEWLHGRGRPGDLELAEVVIAGDVRACGAARIVVAQCLGGRVVASALADGQLLICELVANSLQHSDVSGESQLVISVELTPDWFRLGVRDGGSDAVIAVREPDLEAGGGFGLALVQALSERWGVVRHRHGGTQVWAQLVRSPRG